jgi:hypothetical protein
MAGQIGEYANPEAKATYQVVLNRIYLEYLERMFARDFFGAWEVVRVWYEQLPEECQKEVEESYEETSGALRDISSRCNQLDLNVQRATRHRNCRNYLYVADHRLGKLFTHSLEKHGWLVKDASARPKVREPGHLGFETS